MQTPMFELYGQGNPALIMLHGARSSLRAWEPLIQPLQRYSITWLALDLFGHGQSPPLDNIEDSLAMATSLLNWLNHRMTAPVILVGHSRGGRFALEMATLLPKSPRVVRGLILISPSGQPKGFNPKSLRSLPRLQRAYADKGSTLTPYDAERYQEDTFLARQFEAQFDKLDDRNLFGVLPRLHKVRVPVHLIWGDSDQIVDPSWSGVLRRKIPCRTRLIVVPNAAHMAMQEQPTVVTAIIRQCYGQLLQSNRTQCTQQRRGIDNPPTLGKRPKYDGTL